MSFDPNRFTLPRRPVERDLQVALLAACTARKGGYLDDQRVRHITVALYDALENDGNDFIAFDLAVNGRKYRLMAGKIHATKHLTFDVWLDDQVDCELDGCLNSYQVIEVLVTGEPFDYEKGLPELPGDHNPEEAYM